jgi:hypothetical protein
MADHLLVATRKGLFQLGRQNRGWVIDRTSFLADNCTLTARDPRDGTLYAALDHGHFGCKLHRSRDHGATWEEIPVPAFPEKPDGYDDGEPAHGPPAPWTVKLLWSFAFGGADQPGRVWCGTIPGGLFVSDDHGDSWQLVESLWHDDHRKAWFGGGYDYAGIHSVCVDPRNSAHLLLGVSCGGIWETRDDGDTWHVKGEGMRAEYMPPEQAFDPHIQDPHILVRCPSQPDTLWVQHHNGVFRSEDNGAHWIECTNCQPSVFGFAAAVHPNDGRTAWFVPAIKDEKRIPVDGKLVVARTRDGGQSFDVLRNGLPQQHAYDLVFRHALDVDDTGERLAFGSTTGSLFITEDAGDTWESITTHLPPVYAVQFVP